MNKILFLGTGGVCGIPEWNCDCEVCGSCDKKDKRLRSSVLISIDDTDIIIDFGPDFRTQLLNNNIKNINYAFLTHAHRDHMNGDAELSRQKNLVLTSSSEVLDEFMSKQGNSRGWFLKRNPTMQINVFKYIKVGNFKIDIIKLKHQKDYVKNVVPCVGYIFRSNSFSFAYMSDYNEILEPEKLENLDLIISDGNGFEYSNTGHMGIKGSVDIFNQFKPKKMILTHINHSKSHEFLSKFVKKFGNIKIAYDGMKINF